MSSSGQTAESNEEPDYSFHGLVRVRTDNTGLINGTGLLSWRKGGGGATKVQLVTALTTKSKGLVSCWWGENSRPQGQEALIYTTLSCHLHFEGEGRVHKCVLLSINITKIQARTFTVVEKASIRTLQKQLSADFLWCCKSQF